MNITKDTFIYGSFAENPGNNGAKFFNYAFEKYGINAIYKPFKTTDTKGAVEAVRVLNFSGAAFTSPHKERVIEYLDYVDLVAKLIGSVNTVVRKGDDLYGYNTDWVGVRSVLEGKGYTEMGIIGKGGFSKTVQYVCSGLGIVYRLFGRDDTIPTDIPVFNATPAEFNLPNIIDGRPHTITGLQIFHSQAQEQFKLFTGIEYE